MLHFLYLILALLDFEIILAFRLCRPTSEEKLQQMLGGAFNGRYMSVNRPPEFMFKLPELTEMEGFGAELSEGWTFLSDQPSAPATESPLFAVSDKFRRVISANHTARKRIRRRTFGASRVPSSSLPWKCESEIHWLDLGQDHFPRYLRSARCTSDKCWYGFYDCRPRAFTVKVLKRVSEKCIPMSRRDLGHYQLPPELEDSDEPVLAQPWVWEEIAVNFCCECSP